MRLEMVSPHDSSENVLPSSSSPTILLMIDLELEIISRSK